MFPAGYLFKRVVRRDDWLGDDRVHDIHSVSSCLSPAFCDYVGYWQHNGCWLFDDPETMRDLAAREGIDLSEMALFFYTLYEQQFDVAKRAWLPLPPPKEPTLIAASADLTLSGFDVVTHSTGATPECSPLSCNRLSKAHAVNAHCLFASFDAAKAAIEAGTFDNAEPGPLRVWGVYTVAARE